MKRLSIDIPDSMNEKIEAMKKDLGIKTHLDLFNNSVTVMGWLIKQRKKGLAVGSYNGTEDQFLELLFPALENIQKEE
jgi:hypothetical protein